MAKHKLAPYAATPATWYKIQTANKEKQNGHQEENLLRSKVSS